MASKWSDVLSEHWEVKAEKITSIVFHPPCPHRLSPKKRDDGGQVNP